MTNLDIEEIGREKDLLIRSCRVRINGNIVTTPTRTIGATLSNIFELNEAKEFITNEFKPFGEVYAKITLSDINEFIENDEKGQQFSSKLSNRVSQMKQANALPYILLSITDDNGNPFNQLLPPRAQKFVFDILWGIPGNSIIVTPLLGVMINSEDYSKMIDAFYERQIAAIDRKNQPLMAVVPSSYSLIDPKLIEKYWNCGVRIFGYDCANKKYGAYAHTIESLHIELSRLSRESEENYIINGINSKYKYGKGTTSRIHNLIGVGFGFDTYSPNHMQARFFSKSIPARYIFNDENYGFLNIKELMNIGGIDDIIKTKALKSADLSELEGMNDYQLKKLCSAHDIEKTIKEIQNYKLYIDDNTLLDYFSSKEKIHTETAEITAFRNHHNTDDWWFDDGK
jgi:hypothetical protein